jgi:cytochrome P450
MHNPIVRPFMLSQASEDDVIPLSKPIVTPSGNTVDHIAVAKGTVITVPIHSINRSVTFWGEDAKKFVPARWLNEAGTEKAKDISGHRHLLTFVDGPRMCLGRGFALAEFKVCTVLFPHHPSFVLIVIPCGFYK